MAYRYKRGQLFRKKLDVPTDILNAVYNCSLSFTDYIKYDLMDKIPLTCLDVLDRQLVEKFGIEKIKVLDLELFDKKGEMNVKNDLLSVDSTVTDINMALYEKYKDELPPAKYTAQMKKIYSSRLIELDSEYEELQAKFNNGELSLEEIIYNWSLFKEKDLDYCLRYLGIKTERVRNFMEEYEAFIPLFMDNLDINEIITNLIAVDNHLEKEKYVTFLAEKIINSTFDQYGRRTNVNLSNEEYKLLFDYVSIDDYILKIYGYSRGLLEELKELGDDYIYNLPFDVSVLFDRNVLKIVSELGLKNIVDFDNECGHFFTADNCRMLRLMDDAFFHYGRYDYYDDSFYEMDFVTPKDKFYEEMRRFIISGPSDSTVLGTFNYQNITGDFRDKNPDLFIDESAPEELKKLFYSRSITADILINNPEYIPYLKDKNFDVFFVSLHRNVYVERKNQHLYQYFSKKYGFEETIKFILEYDYLLENILVNSAKFSFENCDSMEDVVRHTNEVFLNLVLQNRQVKYPSIVPDGLRKQYPNMFLDERASEKLRKAFYDRTFSIDDISSLSMDDLNYLKKVNLELVYKYMPVGTGYNAKNIVALVKEVFKEDAFDVMLSYGKFLERIYVSDKSRFYDFRYRRNMSKEDLLLQMDKFILNSIMDGKIKYDDTMLDNFKNNNPTLFLPTTVPKDIRDKFYNRELTLSDFQNNMKLLDYFESTNIGYGLGLDYVWIANIFKEKDIKLSNVERLKVLCAFEKISDASLQNIFKKYLMENETNISIDKIELVADILQRLSLSNATEMYAFRDVLATQILDTDNPMETLDKIEKIFIKNNVPVVAKLYSVFETLHPGFSGFDFSESSKVSPILKKKSINGKNMIVFADLLKASFGSNNRSLRDYLDNIETGYNIYISIKNGEVTYEELDNSSKRELQLFRGHLVTLYNNTMKGKKQIDEFAITEDIVKDIDDLKSVFSIDGNTNYDLKDRLVSMFCHFAGIDTFQEAREYLNGKVAQADKRNRLAASKNIYINAGDLIKGIGNINYLTNILQNGSVAKEYLGASAGSDRTPLDTDLSMALNGGSFEEVLKGMAAKGYGPIYLVLKNDDRFVESRKKSGEENSNYNQSKMELFYTGVQDIGETSEHYGIRTGFASTEIDYIVCEPYDSRVELEVVKNGFYIPIADASGKIIFTPEMYDKLREKMGGLSYLGVEEYHFSSNLVSPGVEEIVELLSESERITLEKREKINSFISEALSECGLVLKTAIDGDLTDGFVELIDTGSTGRGTNKPGDGDFDFMMRLDRRILENEDKLAELKATLLKKLGINDKEGVIASGDFRLKKVNLDGTVVDIDITFCPKTNQVSYSTDMALQDRLESIRKQDPEKYQYVVANILLAKQILKEAGVYKPNRGEVPQGGLGGIGIENWILQNGGSFIDACESFVQASEGKTFNEFKESYHVWDFGENHMASRKGVYKHDDFVTCNMSEEGYYKMRGALKNYLDKYNNKKSDDKKY